MAVATGMVVASNYYAQPLLDSIANYFHISATLAGFIVTTAQLSYAVGLMLLVPLGDIFERRSLIITMTLISASGLLITAMASNIWVMLIELRSQGCSPLWLKFLFLLLQPLPHLINEAKQSARL